MAEDIYRREEVDRRLQWLETRYANFNAEMGNIQAKTEWLTWATRWIIAGIFGNLFLALASILITLSIR